MLVVPEAVSNIEIGAKGEFLAMKEFVNRDWAVFVPISAPTAVDFIAYNPRIPKTVRVQVKSGMHKDSSDGHSRKPRVVILKGKGSANGGQSNYKDDDFDLLAIVYNHSSVFLIGWPFYTKTESCVCIPELMAYTADKWSGFIEDRPKPIAIDDRKYLVEDMF